MLGFFQELSRPRRDQSFVSSPHFCCIKCDASRASIFIILECKPVIVRELHQWRAASRRDYLHYRVHRGGIFGRRSRDEGSETNLCKPRRRDGSAVGSSPLVQGVEGTVKEPENSELSYLRVLSPYTFPSTPCNIFSIYFLSTL